MKSKLVISKIIFLWILFAILSCRDEVSLNNKLHSTKNTKEELTNNSEKSVLNAKQSKICILIKYNKSKLDFNKTYNILEIKSIFKDVLKVEEQAGEYDPSTIFIEGKNFNIILFENYISELTFTSNEFEIVKYKIRINDNIREIIKDNPNIIKKKEYYILYEKQCECSYIFYYNKNNKINKISVSCI